MKISSTLGVSLEQVKCEKTFTRIGWSCRVFTIIDTMEGINAIWCGYCRFIDTNAINLITSIGIAPHPIPLPLPTGRERRE